MGRKLIAEAIGTFWLTFGGCGSVVLWGHGADMTVVCLAFGLTVVTMAYAIGHISGCHLNPAVSIGLAVGGRFPMSEVPGYVGAQVVGGLLAALLLFVMTKDLYGAKALGANDYHTVLSGALSEFVLSFMFLFVIMGATAKRATPGFAGLVIGLCLALIHMIGIPVTGVSVNPARSIGPAIFQGGDYIKHLWMFIIVPPLGAAVGAMAYKLIDSEG
jgi:aquaporin Z